jgi:APA family basic amino acid/polyamine antiporter
MTPRTTPLRREIGLAGATMLGLGSILGTGIFVSIGITSGVTGPAIILAIALAAALAACNALSSAQLAAVYPVSGGTYEYGYRLLRPAFGFIAGWMFLSAKSASAATAALGVAGYGLHLAGYTPDGRLPGTAAVIAVVTTALALSGLRRSSVVNIAIMSLTVTALGALGLAGFFRMTIEDISVNFFPFYRAGGAGALHSLLYATALMFVAYTGYGRIATMSEEVSDPRRTIPRAIIMTLIVSAVLYMLVAIAAIGAVGTDTLSASAGTEATPLEAAAKALNIPGLTLLVAFGAVTAMLGVLLNLILGLSRVILAMGRRADLPRALAHVTHGGNPDRAILLTGLTIAMLALIGNIETVWSFSALTVLIYYTITNLAALRLPRSLRIYPRWVSVAGLVGCLGLAAFIPPKIWLAGGGVAAAGFSLRLLIHRLHAKQAKHGDFTK